MEQTQPTNWLSILASSHANVPRRALTRSLQAFARWAGVRSLDGRPKLGSVSDSWLREFDAESGKHGVEHP